VLTMPVETKPFDEADYLTSEKLIEGYLDGRRAKIDANNPEQIDLLMDDGSLKHGGRRRDHERV
jgi:hypothetical protein